jgi:hypothetical protein
MIQPARGLIADMISPVGPSGAVDAGLTSRLIGRVRPQADGVSVGGLGVGRGLELASQTRLDVLAAAVDALSSSSSDARPALFFEITAPTADETHRLLSAAETVADRLTTGQPVFWLLTPLILHGNRDLPDFIKDLGGATRRRLVLVNRPDLVATKRSPIRHKNIRTAIVKKMGPNEQVVGLVHHGDLDRSLAYQRAVGGRPQFRFYDGSEENFLNRPSKSGLLSAGAVLLPDDWAAVVASSLNPSGAPAGFPGGVNRIWRSGARVRRLADLIRPDPPRMVAAALDMIGAGPVPDHLGNLTPEALSDLRLGLDALGFFEERGP